MTKAQTAEHQEIIDEYGETCRLADLWRPQINPHLFRKAELMATMQSWYQDHPADQTALEEGKLYQLEVSQRHNERELTEEATHRAFYKFQRLKIANAAGKVTRFPIFSVFSVTLESIKKYLGEPYLDSIAPKHRTGRRVYNVVARIAAGQKAAA